jgi:hypothetical protein
MTKYIFTGIVLLLFTVFELHAQTKFEHEVRIEIQQVPDSAIAFFSTLHVPNKVKWYREHSHEGLSYEAKTKWHNTRYSIEFDAAGSIQDVEYIIGLKDINNSVKDIIIHQLDSIFCKYKILKIQKQYSGKPSVLKKLLLSQTCKQEYTTKYEIIIDGKQNGYRKKYEVTTDNHGTIQHIVQIVPPDMNILTY